MMMNRYQSIVGPNGEKNCCKTGVFACTKTSIDIEDDLDYARQRNRKVAKRRCGRIKNDEWFNYFSTHRKTNRICWSTPYVLISNVEEGKYLSQ